MIYSNPENYYFIPPNGSTIYSKKRQWRKKHFPNASGRRWVKWRKGHARIVKQIAALKAAA